MVNMTDTRCTKRDFLKKLGIGLGSLAVSSTVFKGLESLVNTADAETHDGASGYAESAVHVPTMAEIEMLMARGSVDKILEEEYDLGTIEQIETKGFRGKKTTFREKVYQEDKTPLDKRPSLVMFYNNSSTGQNSEAQTREAIIFKSLANYFSKDVNFYTYDVRKSDGYSKKKSEGYHGGKEVNEEEGITAIPSIGMYSIFDLVEYEEPKINDGWIKQIDILQGGPQFNSQIPKIINSLPKWWIKPNLFSEPTPSNNGKLYRFKNSFAFQEIKGFKYH
jgi:hypothetical protein